MSSPDLSRIPSFYHNYISQVTAPDLSSALAKHQQQLVAELKEIPGERWDYRYAEGKWSIKELVQHIIDGERVFCYRALRFARKDATELPGFDENLFNENAHADRRTKEDLIEELAAVQKASVLLFRSFDEDQLEASGVANGNAVYVRGIGFIIVGHALHHLNILKERYLSRVS
jgi:hypothetical protein